MGTLAGMFCKRICRKSRGLYKFVTDGQQLSKQGVVWVPMLHTGHEWAGCKERKTAGSVPGIRNQREWQAKQLTELQRIANCLLHMLLPGGLESRGVGAWRLTLAAGQRGLSAAFLERLQVVHLHGSAPGPVVSIRRCQLTPTIAKDQGCCQASLTIAGASRFSKES